MRFLHPDKGQEGKAVGRMDYLLACPSRPTLYPFPPCSGPGSWPLWTVPVGSLALWLPGGFDQWKKPAGDWREQRGGCRWISQLPPFHSTVHRPYCSSKAHSPSLTRLSHTAVSLDSSVTPSVCPLRPGEVTLPQCCQPQGARLLISLNSASPL